MQSNPRDPSKPPNPNPNASPLPSSPSPPPPAGSLVMFPNPLRGSHHRRARSELAFRIPDEFSDPMTSQCNTSSFDEIGSEDDLFSSFMDMQKIGCRLDGNGSRSDSGACQDPTSESGGSIGKEAATMMVKPKHKYSSSVDGSSTMTSAAMRGGEGGGVFGELMEAKKAMTAEQLAELAAVDPKRAKRILANRQSAARSKERKARYILELERKVQTLQTEATTLSAQLTLYQRDTKGLSAENAELKIRLQAMEQQAQLRDALNEALKQEVERLRIATGEIASPSESYSLGLQQQMSYNNSFFSFPHQQPNFNQSHSDFSNHQQEPLGRSLQGLDISKGSSIVKTENSSVSATESSSTCNQG